MPRTFFKECKYLNVILKILRYVVFIDVRDLLQTKPQCFDSDFEYFGCGKVGSYL